MNINHIIFGPSNTRLFVSSKNVFVHLNTTCIHMHLRRFPSISTVVCPRAFVNYYEAHQFLLMIVGINSIINHLFYILLVHLMYIFSVSHQQYVYQVYYMPMMVKYLVKRIMVKCLCSNEN